MHGLSLGNLTTYPAINCIQGLDPPFFLISAFVPRFDCLRVRTARGRGGERVGRSSEEV